MRWGDGPIINPIDRLAIENGFLSGRELIRQRMRQRAERVPTPELPDWSDEQFGVLAYQQAKAAEAMREHQCALWHTEPQLTEFGRSAADEDEPDMALLGMVIVLASCAFTMTVLYLIGRYLP